MLKSRAPLLKQFYNRDKRREAHALNILEELPEVRENMGKLLCLGTVFVMRG